MPHLRPSLLTLTLLRLLSSPAAAGPGSSRKTWPVRTKGQEGLRAPRERATLPVPTSAFSKPAAKPAVRDAETGARVLPIYASDNYISLLPGERRRIDIAVPGATRGMNAEVKGWNVRAATIPGVAAR
jgi:hypothetical protein